MQCCDKDTIVVNTSVIRLDVCGDLQSALLEIPPDFSCLIFSKNKKLDYYPCNRSRYVYVLVCAFCVCSFLFGGEREKGNNI